MKKALVMFVAATFTALLVVLHFSADGLAQRSIRPTDKGGGGRLALVIGNGAYADAPLKNATNDGRDVAAALRRMGFEVIHKENADKRAMVSAIDEFGKRLRSAQVGLLYYAGHGVQVDGRNYLIPVGAHVTSEGDVEFEGVDAGRVLAKMDDAGSAVNVLILDACRDNPFARSFRSESKGLAKMDAPKGTLIAYSTAPGSVAADGEGRNGVFTKCFLEHIGVPGVPVELVLKNVRADVMVETNDKQVPWESSSLTGDFYFVVFSGAAVVERPAAASGKAPAAPGRPMAEGGSLGGKATSKLSVKCNVPGSRVLLDGADLGGVPLEGRGVAAGKHRVSVEKPGYETYRTEVNLEEGRSVTLEAFLEPQGARPGRLFVDLEPAEATVRLVESGRKYERGMELDAGRYQLEVTAPGRTLWKGNVDVAGGEDKYLRVRLDKPGKGEPGEGYTSYYGMKFVWVPAGTFRMGSPESESWRESNEVRHQVKISRPYYLQTTEVTQGQWVKVMGNNPSHFGNCGDDCPVENVSWLEAVGFCNALSEKEGLRPAYRVSGKDVTWDRESDGYRLPTEAEWEYGCRAGTHTAFYTGDITYKKCKEDPALDRAGWFCWNSGGTTHPTGEKAPNAWGLYDMHGNVWEWCWDWGGAYASGMVTDPAGSSDGSLRVDRGGGWYHGARHCRSAYRRHDSPGYRHHDLGFRLCRSAR